MMQWNNDRYTGFIIIVAPKPRINKLANVLFL